MDKVVVDMGLCRSYAICTGIAPDFFSINAQGELELLREDVTDADVQRIQDSIVVCPAQAITVQHHKDPS